MITKAAIMARATVDLKKKLTLEKTVLPELKRLFAEERKLFRESIRTATTQPDRIRMRAMWLETIDKHHRRVSKTFARGFNPAVETLLTLEEEMTVLGKQRTTDIVKTSVKDMKLAKARAIESLVADKITPTPDLIQKTGSKILRRKQTGRLGNISVTETQTPAETTKGVLSTEKDEDGDKTWVTVGDSKVRPSHVLANRQKRKIKKPFNVGSSELRWPGDSKLGAKVGEVAYCRCNAIYS